MNQNKTGKMDSNGSIGYVFKSQIIFIFNHIAYLTNDYICFVAANYFRLFLPIPP